MKRRLMLLVLIGVLSLSALTPSSGQAHLLSKPPSQPQGFGPFAIEVTKDGQYAYLSFDLSEDIFKVRLSDLNIVAKADLSAFFPIECEHIALDATETKLFVYTPTWHKLLVVDTQTMSLIHTINNFNLIGMARSRSGSRLITWNGGPIVQYVDTTSYAVTQDNNNNLYILKVQEDPVDADRWYLAAQDQLGGEGPMTVGLYDHVSKAWISAATFSIPARAAIMDFAVLPGGQKAYLAVFGGWYPENHAFGGLYAVDLITQQTTAVPIDGGAMCLDISSDDKHLFVGTGWPVPNTNNLLVVDTTSDSVVGSIPLGQSPYGWHDTQMNDLQRDPIHPELLYATSTDGNGFLKINTDSQTVAGVHVLNNESFHPHFFARRGTQAFGNILIQQSAKSFELNLDTAQISKLAVFPAIRPDAFAYDTGILLNGNLLIAQGEYFLEVDPQSMQLVATHPLSPSTPSIWHFVLSKDKSRIYTVTNSPGGTANMFLALNSSTFQVEKQLPLAGGDFEFTPFETPDGTKLFALGGMQNEAVVVHVIGTSDLTIQNTITFNQSRYPGISAADYFPYAYDPISRTLFVGATYVVLAINTDTKAVQDVIHLGDVETAMGLQPGSLTYINAVGLVYNPQENYLYLAHVDRGFVSIYDLTNHCFLSTVIPLQGFGPHFLFSDDAYQRIYSVNGRSDSITVIDLASKTVEKVLDLHDYLTDIYLPMIQRPVH